MERKGYVVSGIIVFILLGLMGILFGGDPVEELPGEFETEIVTEIVTKNEDATEVITEENTEPYSENTTNQKSENPVVDMATIPAYNGNAYVSVNNGVPYFAVGDFVTESFEIYAPLDSLGRCGTAYANIGIDIMPTEERGKIGYVKPSGWQTVKYDFVDGKYLYNRCHLIGYQLSGENVNIRNLITGTRYLNTEGMLPFENMVADYVKETSNHVLYRVTPVFEGNNLLASGVLIEAMSVEDEAVGICFCVFCYNVQPSVQIDYTTGMSEATKAVVEETITSTAVNNGETVTNDDSNNITISNTMFYVANKNTKKFHYPSCSSVGEMKEKNKRYMEATREEMIASGYSPCGRCFP